MSTHFSPMTVAGLAAPRGVPTGYGIVPGPGSQSLIAHQGSSSHEGGAAIGAALSIFITLDPSASAATPPIASNPEFS